MTSNSQSDHGAGVLCLVDNQALLVQMNYGPFKGQWILPGGMVESGEHPHEAAVREVKEETNLNVKLEKLLTVRHRIKDTEINNIYWVFTGSILNENPSKELIWPKDELLCARFWDVESLMCEKQVRPHTKHYIKLALEPEQTKSICLLDSSFNDYCYKG